MWKRVKIWWLAALISGFYWLYSRTWRVRHIHSMAPMAGIPRLYAHWHGDELLLIKVCLYRKMAIMASRSQDGELMKRVLGRFGFRVVRGSSTRGGAGGLKGLIDVVLNEGFSASLAVDGPHGPIYKLKPGIMKLAEETGLPIVLGAGSAERRFVFKKAWNRCYLPLPFSRCVVVYSPPIEVPENLSEEAFENFRGKLENQLLLLKSEAEGYFARGL